MSLFQICPICGTQQDIEPYDFCGACGHEWTREEILSSTPVPVENASNTGLQADTSNQCPDCGEWYNWHLPGCVGLAARRAANASR